jgi:tetratricopeptide (TPR) repeat protein
MTTDELQQRISEHDERINEIIQQNPSKTAKRELTEEIAWRMTQTIHYDDALIVHLPLDRTYYGDAYTRAISLGAIERAIVYLERLARNFVEQRGELLRQLAITQSGLSDYFRERGLEERAGHFDALTEANIRESLTLLDDIAGHAVLAELLMKDDDRLDEAVTQLYQAKELAASSSEEAMIENDLASIAVRQEDLEEALRHYQRAAEIDPNFEGVWFNIGFMQRHLERFEEAKATYLHAIEREPQDMLPYSELCAIYMNEHEPEKAREIVERGLRHIPKSAHLLALLSSIYMEEGDLRRAQAILTEAEEIDAKLEIVQSLRDELNRRLKR